MDTLNIKKGNVIAVVEGERRPTSGYRRRTAAEAAEWEEAHRGTFRCDGESHITDGWATDPLTGLFTVVRAKAAPSINWHKQKGMCEVKSMETGQTYFIYRRHIAGVKL